MDTTVTATFCATLVDEWVRGGVTDAFVAPGSRSTPLALELAANDQITVHVFHDERAAAFAALGHGLATSRPAIALCTSGTAAAHFHAAVIEADLSGVPLIVCTADRPPELWSVGAPQTINQTGLYGCAVRWFAEPGVPDDTNRYAWRSLAARSVIEASGLGAAPSGPVHLNLSFRDPLSGAPGPLPEGRPDGAMWHQAPIEPQSVPSLPGLTEELADLAAPDGIAANGVIVAGRGCGSPEIIDELSTLLGWPVLADHRSGCRGIRHSIRFFDSLLRLEAPIEPPQLILRFGETLASKSVSQWITRQAQNSNTAVVTVLDQGRWIDPERVSQIVVAHPGHIGGSVDRLRRSGVTSSDYVNQWHDADAVAEQAYQEATNQKRQDGAAPTETEIMAQVVDGIEPGGALVVSSSMPVRDLEWFGPHRRDIDVFSNRGANGIDGVVSTSIGVALTGQPTTVVVGDIAMVHDSTALAALAARPVNLHIVVIDNNGGGIFSFLPQKRNLDDDTFETLFGTPHGTNLSLLFAAHNIPVGQPGAEPTGEPTTELPPVRASIRFTDRTENQVFRDDIVAKLSQKWLS